MVSYSAIKLINFLQLIAVKQSFSYRHFNNSFQFCTKKSLRIKDRFGKTQNKMILFHGDVNKVCVKKMRGFKMILINLYW